MYLKSDLIFLYLGVFCSTGGFLIAPSQKQEIQHLENENEFSMQNNPF
jgi:hypothetical protein